MVQINKVTQKPYEGKNQQLLAVVAEEKEYQSNEWGTFLQWKNAISRVVKKGEKGCRISRPVKKMEVDKDTGEVEIQKYIAVEDCGNVINPMVVEGQIVGGIAQGVGQALYEHGIYDDEGQLVTGSMLDYTMPRADNFPMIDSDRIETPSPSNSLGVKGVGEMGSITSPPAVVNAVVDALSDYGVKHIDMPLTSEKIWNIIQTNGG